MTVCADVACEIGENPLWHPEERRLYWTDIPRGLLSRYDPASGSHEQCFRGPPVGGFTLQRDGGLLLFMADGAIAELRDDALHYLLDTLPDERGGRFNDVIADSQGGVFCGTMPIGARPGRLYRLGTDGTIHVVLPATGLSNGLGFSPDRRYLYHTDSHARVIRRYSYDADSGLLADSKVLVNTSDEQGVPDGLTVDADGCLWSARWGGGVVVRYAPDGRELERVQLPVAKVSSVCFGGDAYGELYVTTAGGDARSTEGDLAGSLFSFRPTTPGVPEFRSNVATAP
jgi:sugar lactone lactonase YvrE